LARTRVPTPPRPRVSGATTDTTPAAGRTRESWSTQGALAAAKTRNPLAGQSRSITRAALEAISGAGRRRLRIGRARPARPPRPRAGGAVCSMKVRPCRRGGGKSAGTATTPHGASERFRQGDRHPHTTSGCAGRPDVRDRAGLRTGEHARPCGSSTSSTPRTGGRPRAVRRTVGQVAVDGGEHGLGEHDAGPVPLQLARSGRTAAGSACGAMASVGPARRQPHMDRVLYAVGDEQGYPGPARARTSGDVGRYPDEKTRADSQTAAIRQATAPASRAPRSDPRTSPRPGRARPSGRGLAGRREYRRRLGTRASRYQPGCHSRRRRGERGSRVARSSTARSARRPPGEGAQNKTGDSCDTLGGMLSSSAGPWLVL